MKVETELGFQRATDENLKERKILCVRKPQAGGMCPPKNITARENQMGAYQRKSLALHTKSTKGAEGKAKEMARKEKMKEKKKKTENERNRKVT